MQMKRLILKIKALNFVNGHALKLTILSAYLLIAL